MTNPEQMTRPCVKGAARHQCRPAVKSLLSVTAAMQLTSSPLVAAALQYKTPQRRSVWNNKLLWGGSRFPLHSLRNHNFNPLVTAKTIGVFLNKIMFLSQQNNDKRICIYVVCHGLTLTSMVYEFIMGRHVTTKQGSVETEDVNLHRVLKGRL